MKSRITTILASISLGFLILGIPAFVLGDTMSSTSFVITGDDLTAGGGRSSSTSFVSEDTTGGAATGENITSTSYIACAGYPCSLYSEPAAISFSVSPNSVGLGTLTTGSVATGTTTLTTTENAGSGYQVTVIADGHLRNAAGAFVPDVADGTVTAGAGEYGIGLTGTDRAFADDRSVTTGSRVVATNAGSVTNANVVVTFKAAVSNTDAAGAYNQIATFVCTGTF